MKKKRKMFQTREEYEAWLKGNEEVHAELRKRIAMIDAELAARKKPAG
jgi:hypothetical protein